jgi:hypothetical protein
MTATADPDRPLDTWCTTLQLPHHLPGHAPDRAVAPRPAVDARPSMKLGNALVGVSGNGMAAADGMPSFSAIVYPAIDAGTVLACRPPGSVLGRWPVTGLSSAR